MTRTSMLVVATLATLVTGHASRAQTVTLDAGSKQGRAILCRMEFKAIKAKDTKTADDVKVLDFGSQYFNKTCKTKLEQLWDKSHTAR